jgi:hypothetical protein
LFLSPGRYGIPRRGAGVMPPENDVKKLRFFELKKYRADCGRVSKSVQTRLAVHRIASIQRAMSER